MDKLTRPIVLIWLLVLWVDLFVIAAILMYHWKDRATGIGATFAAVTAILVSLIAYSAAMAKVRSDENRAKDDRLLESKTSHLLVERMARNLYTDSKYLIELLNDNFSKGAIKDCLKYDRPAKPQFMQEAMKKAHLLEPEVIVQLTLLEFAVDAALQYSAGYLDETLSEEDENIDVADVGGWFDLGYQNLEGSWRTVASRAKEVVALSGPHALSSSKRTNEELEAAVKLLTDFEDLVTEKPLKNVEIPAVGEAKN